MSNPKLVYERLRGEDILQVASPCFQEGSVDFPPHGNSPVRSRLLSMLIKWAEKAHPDSVADLQSWNSQCTHGRNCEEEYQCEVLAAYILMPQEDFVRRLDDIRASWRPDSGWDPVLWLATIYVVEPWAVRFRLALMDDGYFDPYRDCDA